jgi:hypothetical protein
MMMNSHHAGPPLAGAVVPVAGLLSNWSVRARLFLVRKTAVSGWQQLAREQRFEKIAQLDRAAISRWTNAFGAHRLARHLRPEIV